MPQDANPFSLVRCTGPNDSAEWQKAVLGVMSRVLIEHGYQPGDEALRLPFSMPLDGWEVEASGSSSGSSPFVLLTATAPLVSPSPVTLPSHSVLVAVHTVPGSEALNLFAPYPAWLDEVHPPGLGAFRDMRLVENVSLESVEGLVDDLASRRLHELADIWPLIQRT